MKRRLLYMLSVAAVSLVVVAACTANFDKVAPSPGQGGGGDSGQGGSMARFTIVGDYIYTVDDNTLKTTRIVDPAHPQPLPFKDMALGDDVETIFPYNDKLFIGSRSGMYIYDVSRPGFPSLLSFTSHIRSCDPVVAQGNYAYVTLNSDNGQCGRGRNELIVFDIFDVRNPKQVWTDTSLRYPKGLGIDASLERLFVCCHGGLRVYDISVPYEPVWVDDLTNIPEIGSIDTYDVIPDRGILILIGDDGLYQLDYTGENVEFVSKIDLRGQGE